MSGTDARWAHLHDAQGRKRDWYCEDVLSGNLEVRRVFEDEVLLAFHHPYPEADVHVVVIPKRHVTSLLSTEAADPALLAAILRAVQAIARDLRLDERGFKLSANAAAPGVTPHVHWHVTSPL
ncbi:MAG TPA: HIT domain-containing protein [Candidatus Limnocylindrales bacterium]|nr:HIT domain-containing protein [Candidatus Limnocylindrales bacterium]